VEMLLLGRAATTEAEARSILTEAITSGAAARRAEKMIDAQGGDPRVVESRQRIEVAPEEIVIDARADGFVTRVDAMEIGLAAVAMGAGRTRADQTVDHGVGLLLQAKPGDRVARGQPLARRRVRRKSQATGIVERVRAAFSVKDSPPAPRDLLRGRLE
jgi:thymidine phosphorylase